MKLTLFAACLVAGIALSTCFVHSMPKHNEEEAEEFDCPDEGDFYFPHPDCSKYYQCTNGFPFERNCGGGLFWNPAKNECDFQQNVPECVGGTRPTVGPTDVPTTPLPLTTPEPIITTADITSAPEVTTPEATSAEPEVTTPEATSAEPEVTTPEAELTTPDASNPCTEEGIYAIPSADSCSEYIQCVQGVAIPSTCAAGLLFDPSIGKCNKEELVVCYNPTTPLLTTEVEVTTPETPVTEAPICEAEGIYNKPFPSNCSLFIICAHGVPVIQQCAEGLSFDPIELICVRSEDSTCVVESTTTVAPEITTTYEPEITTEAQQSTTFNPEEPSTVRPPVRCEFDGVYNIPAPEGDCTTYFLCINFIPYVQSCAAGTLFSPVAGQCVREENYECPSDSKPTTAAPATDAPTTAPEVTTEVATTPVPVTDPPATTANEFPCPDAPGKIYYPHPSSCRLFYECKDSQFQAIFDCGTGLWFDSRIQACVYPQDSDCPLESSRTGTQAQSWIWRIVHSIY